MAAYRAAGSPSSVMFFIDLLVYFLLSPIPQLDYILDIEQSPNSCISQEERKGIFVFILK